MRLRKQKNFDKRWLAVAELYLHDEGKSLADNLHVELGCGKGKYLAARAGISPDVFHIGIERNQFALLKSMEAAQQAQLNNIKFIDGDIECLQEWFAKNLISQLDIMFCDPWTKKRYAKRRLTHRRFLKKYHELLKDDGILCVRTDNVALYDFTLEELDACEDWEIVSQTRDLHGVETRGDVDITPYNPMTNYEEKFTMLGVPICEIKVKKQGAVLTVNP